MKGAPLEVVAAIIDGTLHCTACPVRNQRILYNGWKGFHCLKFHILLSPDGMIIHVYGPVEGRCHDETVYKQSGLAEILEKHFWTLNKEPLYIYGDPAYSLGAHVLSPYKGASMMEEQQQWNSKMSHMREAIKWGFKEVLQQFAFLNFAENHQVLLSPCGLFYMVALLLCNAHTIMHSPQIPQYFNCSPPTLDEYFQGGPIGDDEMDSW